MSDYIYKIYAAQGARVGALSDPYAAVAAASMLGDGATVRLDRAKWSIVYTVGRDCPVGESYDRAVMDLGDNAQVLIESRRVFP